MRLPACPPIRVLVFEYVFGLVDPAKLHTNHIGRFPSNVSYSCKPGYAFTGTHKKICVSLAATTIWSGNVECRGIECDALPTVQTKLDKIYLQSMSAQVCQLADKIEIAANKNIATVANAQPTRSNHSSKVII